MFEVTSEHLELVAAHPHLIGHLVGKTKLTPLHSKWILDMWRALDHDGLQAHRGSYKTTAISEVGPIYYLLFNPDDRIGLVRKTATEAQATLLTIKRMMAQEPLQALFYAAHGEIPKPTISRSETVTYSFKKTITKEGSIDAHGLDGSLTGRHYDKMLLDDVITLKDRISKAERERTKDILREIYTNIIDPGKQVIHVGTPWHKDDAWSIAPPSQYHDCYQTNLLSPDEIAHKKSTTTPTLFAINYELRHTATDDLIFGTPGLPDSPWDYSPGISNIYAHVDAKFSGNHYGALTIIGERPDGTLQAKGWVFREHVEDKVGWIIALCRQHRVRALDIEDNPDKGYTAKLLSAVQPDGYQLPVHTYSESTNKHIKIATHLKGRWKDLSFDIDTQLEYREMVSDYREGQEPDDAPDSAASLIRHRFPAPTQSNRNLALYEL